MPFLRIETNVKSSDIKVLYAIALPVIGSRKEPHHVLRAGLWIRSRIQIGNPFQGQENAEK
jgi:hypothetical protein